jgi:hypothetical protein
VATDRAIPPNVVVYKQGDDGESPKFKKNSNWRTVKRISVQSDIGELHENLSAHSDFGQDRATITVTLHEDIAYTRFAAWGIPLLITQIRNR